MHGWIAEAEIGRTVPEAKQDCGDKYKVSKTKTADQGSSLVGVAHLIRAF